MNWMFVFLSLFGVAASSNYSYPRILIVGPSGVGKSSLGNVLAGCDPQGEGCDSFFPICNNLDSCTKETTIAEAIYLGQWAGENSTILDGGNVTLIDSPGFGDTDHEGDILIAEMVDVLKNNLEEANTILLCFELGKWDDKIFGMLQELESLFGRDRLWNNVIVEITKWAYDSVSIENRERAGITEAKTMANINQKLQENFHLNFNLSGVFIDSWAVYHPNDDQMKYFLNYSRTLWETANAMEPFSFYTIEDILNQLHTCQIKNDCLNEVLEERITSIENNVNSINSTVTNDINELTTNVATNEKQIQKNELVIDSNFEENKKSLKTNADNIKTNTGHITTNTNAISGLTETTSRFVSYCGFKYIWDSTGTITYERLATSVNSFSTGGLSTSTGVFTAPTTGTYLITHNFFTVGPGFFYVYINYNGQDLNEGDISSYSTDDDGDMSGRTLTLQLKTNDKLYLNVHRNDYYINYITFCITLLH